MTRCMWCLETHGESCPRLVALGQQVYEPVEVSTADDINSALADRMHRYRAYSRGLEALLRQSDTTIPTEVLALNPDGSDE